jgi:hypothetical protein
VRDVSSKEEQGSIMNSRKRQKALKPFFLSFAAKKETKKLSRRVKKLPCWESPDQRLLLPKIQKLASLKQFGFFHGKNSL